MKLKLRLLLAFVLFVAILISFVYQADNGIDAYGNSTMKNYVNTKINDTILDYVNRNQDIFSSAVQRTYNDIGELTHIGIDGASLNKIQAALKKEILETLSQISAEVFYIPVGNLTGIKLLSDTGPKIKIKIAPLGTIASDAISEFEAVGINNILHKVGVEYAVSFQAASPFKSTAYEGKYFVLISETIIIGKTPEVVVN